MGGGGERNGGGDGGGGGGVLIGQFVRKVAYFVYNPSVFCNSFTPPSP